MVCLVNQPCINPNTLNRYPFCSPSLLRLSFCTHFTFKPYPSVWSRSNLARVWINFLFDYWISDCNCFGFKLRSTIPGKWIFQALLLYFKLLLARVRMNVKLPSRALIRFLNWPLYVIEYNPISLGWYCFSRIRYMSSQLTFVLLGSAFCNTIPLCDIIFQFSHSFLIIFSLVCVTFSAFSCVREDEPNLIFS